MTVRSPAAAHFYAGDCARATDQFLKDFVPPQLAHRAMAGIVPHAGWVYSGAVAAQVFASMRVENGPTTLVIFGTPHSWGGETAVYARGAWATPLGDLAVDEELAAAILREADGLCEANLAAHDGEHSIEVQLPFIKHLFLDARIVPIAVRPDKNAIALGEKIGTLLQRWPQPAVVIGSTDLTHYGDIYRFTPAGYGEGAHQWMQANDRRILQLAEQMRSSEIVPEALTHHNACGPGAMAATVAAASLMGAERGTLLQYTTSFEVVPEDGEFQMAVGYAGILY